MPADEGIEDAGQGDVGRTRLCGPYFVSDQMIAFLNNAELGETIDGLDIKEMIKNVVLEKHIITSGIMSNLFGRYIRRFRISNSIMEFLTDTHFKFFGKQLKVEDIIPECPMDRRFKIIEKLNEGEKNPFQRLEEREGLIINYLGIKCVGALVINSYYRIPLDITPEDRREELESGSVLAELDYIQGQLAKR
jgi:hypothetical protein